MAKKNENVAIVKENLANGSHFSIHWKWGVSRAYETNGYNICSCYVGSHKVGRVMGGGYDMKGASLAEFINAAYKEELLALGNADLYGLNRAKKYAYVDGACGIDCMIKILKALGFVVEYFYMGINEGIYTIKKA